MFLSWLQRRPTSSPRRTRKGTALFVEALDERCVPSATPVMQAASQDFADVDLPASCEDVSGAEVFISSEAPALQVVLQAEEVSTTAPETSQETTLADQLFQASRPASPSEEVPTFAFPIEAVEVVLVGLESPFAGEGCRAASPAQATPHLDYAASPEAVAATADVSVGSLSTAELEVESLDVQGEREGKAPEVETGAEADADEVIEEMVAAIAVEEVTCDIILAYTEEEGEETL